MQAPLGLTVFLGVLVPVAGLTGALGGQWLAARRDDRRWLRERAARLEDRAHDDLVYWRGERVRVYGSFTTAMNNWRVALWRRNLQSLPELIAVAEDAYGATAIVGTDVVRGAATDLLKEFRLVHQAVLDGGSVDTTPLVGHLRTFNHQARTDLQVPDDAANRASPPAVTT
ncbi:hypothetical protein ACFQV2_30825 [Actinokineospora soli]|uniref:Secreted protein n=1 Tax=Actinokineospora soli TaxID=1048753 RepID=A0ABW2TWJ3_9PSEU